MLQRYRVPVLGVEVTPLSTVEVARLIRECLSISDKERRLIVAHNLHSCFLYHTDNSFAEIYDRADAVLVDGQPVRWCGRLSREKGKVWNQARRVGSVDWLREAGNLWSAKKVAVIGAISESNSLTVSRLAEKLDAEVRGWSGEDWNRARARRVCAELWAFQPQITVIGLGMPLQERFFHDFEGDLPNGIFALVGGAIDQLNGTQRRSPDWIGKLGLEWAWRLASNPKKFAGRYLVEPFKLVWVLGVRVWKRLLRR